MNCQFRMIVESRKFVPESETASLRPIGLEANRKSLETAIDWSFEQRIEAASRDGVVRKGRDHIPPCPL